MAKEILTAVLENTSDKDWDDFHDGRYWYVAAGEMQSFPERVAKFFIGDWDLDDPKLVQKERNRVLCRMGIPQLQMNADYEHPLKLRRLVHPRNVDVPPKQTKTSPATILPQDDEPEFEAKPASKKPKNRKKAQKAPEDAKEPAGDAKEVQEATA